MEKGIDKELQKLVLANAPQLIAHCGDIVSGNWGDWKKPHDVMIDTIMAEVVSLNRVISDDPIIGVELCYFALRLNKDKKPREKYGIVLSYLTNKDGLYWERKGKSFNHVGLSFTIEEIPENQRLTYLEKSPVK